MRISDWSSDVCSSDLVYVDVNDRVTKGQVLARLDTSRLIDTVNQSRAALAAAEAGVGEAQATVAETQSNLARLQQRSEEHTSELQSLMRISYAVFCLKKKKKKHIRGI